MDKWGRLDILVNNAGTTKFMNHDDLEGLNAEDFEQIYALNLIGPYQMIKHARPHLAKSDAPSVVNISSVAGVRGIGSSIAYVASKGALNSTTLALARSLGPENIRVNAVCFALSARIGFAMPLGTKCSSKLPKANATARQWDVQEALRIRKGRYCFCQSRQRPCDRPIAGCRCGYAFGYAVQNQIGASP